MDFLETPRFPLCPAFGYSAEPRYSVTRIERAGGHDQANLNWSRVKHRYSISIPAREVEAIAEAHEFYHAVAGTAGRFRFQDHADYKSCRVHANPTPLDAPLVLDASVSPALYVLTKRYTIGALSRDREIRKPVAGTIRVADNGVEKVEGVDWTLDPTWGTVEIAFVPAGALTWGGEFDTPVRFASEFPVEMVERQIQSVSFMLEECRLRSPT